MFVLRLSDFFNRHPCSLLEDAGKKQGVSPVLPEYSDFEPEGFWLFASRTSLFARMIWVNARLSRKIRKPSALFSLFRRQKG